ncbi:MAG: hypothetical protein ACOCZ6_00330 [Nanoarchaeota archaeon]
MRLKTKQILYLKGALAGVLLALIFVVAYLWELQETNSVISATVLLLLGGTAGVSIGLGNLLILLKSHELIYVVVTGLLIVIQTSVFWRILTALSKIKEHTKKRLVITGLVLGYFILNYAAMLILGRAVGFN